VGVSAVKTPSRWNRALDRRIAAQPLTTNEGRLLDVIYRRTLGWNRTSDRVGERRLMELCGFDHRKTLFRAREGLIEKGLIRYEPGRGQGHFSLYVVILEPLAKRGTGVRLPVSPKGGAGVDLSASAKGGTGVRERGTPVPALNKEVGKETPKPKPALAETVVKAEEPINARCVLCGEPYQLSRLLDESPRSAEAPRREAVALAGHWGACPACVAVSRSIVSESEAAEMRLRQRLATAAEERGRILAAAAGGSRVSRQRHSHGHPHARTRDV
jgi:hypothetical protein